MHRQEKVNAMSRDYAGLANEISVNLDDEVFCTRMIRRAVQLLALLTDENDIAAFHARPASTESAQWDALIAGVAAHTWSLSGHNEPLDWTKPLNPLPEWWEPAGSPQRWRFWNMLQTPPSLQARKVIFPRQWLEAV